MVDHGIPNLGRATAHRPLKTNSWNFRFSPLFPIWGSSRLFFCGGALGLPNAWFPNKTLLDLGERLPWRGCCKRQAALIFFQTFSVLAKNMYPDSKRIQTCCLVSEMSKFEQMMNVQMYIYIYHTFESI